MKLKKSISIILSCAMAANLTCSYIAQASANKEVDAGTTPISEAATEKNNDLIVNEKETESEVKKTEEQQKDVEVIESRLSRKELIDKFMIENSKYFPKSKIRDISSKLRRLNDEDIHKLSALEFHNPKHVRLISIFFGGLGIDRMLIGKVGTGILKLLLNVTIIPSFIWWLVDIFKIGKLTKEQNWKALKKELRDI